MADDRLDRVREIALALPRVMEHLSDGAPCFFVSDRSPICRYHHSDSSDNGRTSIWCPTSQDALGELIVSDPDRYFAPTPTTPGFHGDWIGVRLDENGDRAVDWDEIRELIENAYRLRGTRRLITKLDQMRTARPERAGTTSP